jgi:hypothetical protein
MSDEERTGVLRISRDMLHKVLRLPKDLKVAAVHFDADRDALLLRLDGPSMPLKPAPNECLTRVDATYVERRARKGELITELKMIEAKA